MLSDTNKKSFIIFVRNHLFLKNYVTSEGESLSTMFDTTNLSPMLVTKLVFKLILVLSSYQTCAFPKKGTHEESGKTRISESHFGNKAVELKSTALKLH